MSIRLTLQALSTELTDEGDTVRTLCPTCGGGSSEEDSFVVTRSEGGLVYVCHRASCGEKGAWHEGGVRTQPTEPKPKPHKTWDGETTNDIPQYVIDYMADEWHFDATPEGWYWTEDFGGRLAMSVVAYNGRSRGWVLRSIHPNVRTKAYTYYFKPDTPKASWYNTCYDCNTVLVEDIPSAVRASRYMNAIALLGTGCSPDTAQEIASAIPAHARVIVALDNDATTQAIKLAQRYALLWRNVSVLPLERDLKNMTEEELCKKLTPVARQKSD